MPLHVDQAPLRLPRPPPGHTDTGEATAETERPFELGFDHHTAFSIDVTPSASFLHRGQTFWSERSRVIEPRRNFPAWAGEAPLLANAGPYRVTPSRPREKKDLHVAQANAREAEWVTLVAEPLVDGGEPLGGRKSQTDTPGGSCRRRGRTDAPTAPWKTLRVFPRASTGPCPITSTPNEKPGKAPVTGPPGAPSANSGPT